MDGGLGRRACTWTGGSDVGKGALISKGPGTGYGLANSETGAIKLHKGLGLARYGSLRTGTVVSPRGTRRDLRMYS
jgi:hypothetical protein